MSDKHISTRVIHDGEPNPRIYGAVAIPIFQTAMFETAGDSEYHNVRYTRLNNTPNHDALHSKLASIENAEAALVTASGMAAITTTMLTVLKSGDHILLQNCLYGGTHDFVTKDLADFGIEYNFVDGNDPTSWEAHLRPSTKAFYVESISNPLVGVSELEAAAQFARAHNLVSMIDNTFASPINFRPAEWGFDISLHSGTKYLNGHSDLIAGAVIGKADLVERIRRKLNHLGGSMDPHACFLLHRGIKTLSLRVERQNANALGIARFLEGHPRVAKVNYSGLESDENHARAKKFFDGYGGMLSFELTGGGDAAGNLMNRVTIPIVTVSLGGVETLITRPALSTHQGLSEEHRAALGIKDSLLRFSVGIESMDDLIDDLRVGLES